MVNHWIDTALTMICIISYFSGAIRLVCFQRNGHRIRRGVSLIASILIGTLFCAGLDIVLQHPHVSFFQAVTSGLVCLFIFRTRGNVAALMRITD